MADTSLISVMLRAPLLIKVIVIALLLCSVMSVAIILFKIFSLRGLNRLSNEFEGDFWASKSLDRLFLNLQNSSYDPLSSMFCAAMSEWKDIVGNTDDTALIARRIERATNIIARKKADELERGMGFLSAIGTNGVIIGIFGTVLGIMNGFKAIAVSKSTNIAVIAPIISEALITTAIGLIAAIPAAIAYNILTSKINSYVTRMENFQDEICSIIVRNIQ